MKKILMTAIFAMTLVQSAMASHSIPISGCENGRIISSDNGELHCLSQERPCKGRMMELTASDDGGPGLACIKDCVYIDRAEGGEGLTCLDLSKK